MKHANTMAADLLSSAGHRLTAALERVTELERQLAAAKEMLSKNEGRVKEIVDEHLLRERDDLRAQLAAAHQAIKDFVQAFEGDFVMDDGSIVDDPQEFWTPIVDLYREFKAALAGKDPSRGSQA